MAKRYHQIEKKIKKIVFALCTVFFEKGNLEK